MPCGRSFLTVILRRAGRQWVIALLTALPALSHAVDAAWRFAPLPTVNARTTTEQNRPLADQMATILGRDVTIQHFHEYRDIISDFNAGKVDFAYFGPLPLMALMQSGEHADPIAVFRESDGNSRYHCELVGPIDGITGFGAMRAHLDADKPLRVGLTQPLSTCGYLATFWMLDRAGIPVKAIEGLFAGSHEEVALGVLRNTYDVGGIKQSISKRYRSLGLQPIDQSPPFPGFVLVANRNTVSQAERDLLRSQLVALDEEARRKLIRGKYGFASADALGLDAVERMLTTLGLDIPGLERKAKPR